jgi:hypothetical protein
VSLSWSLKSVSSPWIGTLEPQLHYDLQTLAEWGYLDVATVTYPVPWKGIEKQLNKLHSTDLPPSAAVAARRLKYYLLLQKQRKNLTSVRLYGASEESRFRGLDTQQSDKAQFSVTHEVYADRWAGQLSINQLSGGKMHFDQSFIAYQFGDWNLRAGAIDQWWGPAQSSSLILSNNARPVPAIALSRSSSGVSKQPWLKFLGPWYLTMQLGQLENDRAIPDTKLWMTRFTFKPLTGLELGASWVAMWGGNGQGNSLSDFFDVLTFKAKCANGTASCDDELDTTKGNHLAGFDIKYSFLLFERPVSVYLQRIGEEASDYINITDQANLFGISTYIWAAKVYLEASDTNISCVNSIATANNCYYEHSEYQSGYRFHDRAIGSTFDSDAKMLTLGLNKHFANGDVIDITLRHVELNADGIKPSPVLGGLSEEVLQLGGFYQTAYGDWLLKFGAQIEKSDVEQQASETNGMIYTQIKYSFR